MVKNAGYDSMIGVEIPRCAELNYWEKCSCHCQWSALSQARDWCISIIFQTFQLFREDSLTHEEINTWLFVPSSQVDIGKGFKTNFLIQTIFVFGKLLSQFNLNGSNSFMNQCSQIIFHRLQKYKQNPSGDKLHETASFLMMLRFIWVWCGL